MEKKQKRNSKQTGRWSSQEHSQFIQALMNHGKNWRLVQEAVKTRTITQVRSHAQKFFNRLTKSQRSILLPFEGQQEEMIQKNKRQPVNNKQNQQSPQKQIQAQDIQNLEASSQSELQQEGLETVPQQDPLCLLQIIKKQSNDGKNKVQIKDLIKKLSSESQNLSQSINSKRSSQKSEELVNLERSKNQMDNFTSLLIAYITLSESQQPHDESFFLTVVRKYRKFIYRNNFLKLVDLPCKQQIAKDYPNERKKSFSLTKFEEGQNLNKIQTQMSVQTEKVQKIFVLNVDQSSQVFDEDISTKP